MPKELKAKTIGVSFHPHLREAAADRSTQLGLSFSKYVTLCVEAELAGRVPSLLGSDPVGVTPRSTSIDIDDAIERGGRYSEAKAASIDFENDIERILAHHDYDYERNEKIAHLRTDFLVQQIDEEGSRPRRIALECSHDIRKRYEVALGQAILLKSMPNIDGDRKSVV